MPKSSVNASLSNYDDIFSTEESRQEEQREQVQQIPIGELFPFKNHPFKVLDDDSMSDTVESVKQYGVLSPLIARPRPKGGYEIISGHRRQHAAELAGLETLPVIVRQMDDDAAIILMVDSNLQREHILPSERAFAYKMKLDAMKNQGTRSDLTSTQVVSKLRSNEKLGAENNQSRETVRRFIRLTNLMQEEIDHKTVNFAISTVKLSARTLLKGAQFFLRQYDKSASQGKQSMKRLIRQNRGVTNLEIEKTGIKDFDRCAKRYHIDYAIQKDLSCTPPRFLIFFKAQDADALNAAFKEYSAAVLNKAERPSVLAKLHDLAQVIANLPDKVRHKEEERGL